MAQVIFDFDRLTKTVIYTRAEVAAFQHDIAVPLDEFFQNHEDQITRQRMRMMAADAVRIAQSVGERVTYMDDSDLCQQLIDRPGYKNAVERVHEERILPDGRPEVVVKKG